MAESVSNPHEQAYGMLPLQHCQDCLRLLEPALQAKQRSCEGRPHGMQAWSTVLSEEG